MPEEPLLLSEEALEALNEDFDADQYQMDLASIREDAGIQAGVKPPNYHKSTEPETISCGNCVFFEDGQCTLYNVGVDKDWVCDAWTPSADF
jgi:hypothetical protein